MYPPPGAFCLATKITCLAISAAPYHPRGCLGYPPYCQSASGPLLVKADICSAKRHVRFTQKRHPGRHLECPLRASAFALLTVANWHRILPVESALRRHALANWCCRSVDWSHAASDVFEEMQIIGRNRGLNLRAR